MKSSASELGLRLYLLNQRFKDLKHPYHPSYFHLFIYFLGVGMQIFWNHMWHLRVMTIQL